MSVSNTESIKAIIGLGNPGTQYENSRHNIGFKIIDTILTKVKDRIETYDKYSGIYCLKNISGRAIHFFKPMLYMNLSGSSVKKLVDFEGLKPTEILVIHDDMDFDLGVIKIKVGGGSGGHNGIESIIENLQTENFARIRIGIGRNKNGTMKDYVLENFREDELEELKNVLEKSSEAIKLILAKDIHLAMNIINAFKIKSKIGDPI